MRTFASTYMAKQMPESIVQIHRRDSQDSGYHLHGLRNRFSDCYVLFFRYGGLVDQLAKQSIVKCDCPQSQVASHLMIVNW